MSIDKIGTQPLGMDDGGHDETADAGAAKVRGTEALQGGEMVKGIAEQETPLTVSSKPDTADASRLGEHKTQGLLVRDQLQLGDPVAVKGEAIPPGDHKNMPAGDLQVQHKLQLADEKTAMQLAARQPRKVDDLQIKHKLQLGDELTAQTQHKLPGDLQIKHKIQLGDEKVALISHRLPGGPQVKQEVQLGDERVSQLSNELPGEVLVKMDKDMQVQGKVKFADERMIAGALDERSVWAAKLQGGDEAALKIDDVKGHENFEYKEWIKGGQEIAEGKHWKVEAGLASGDGIKEDVANLVKSSVKLDQAGKSWAGVGATVKHDAVEGKHVKMAENLGMAPTKNIWGDRIAGESAGDLADGVQIKGEHRLADAGESGAAFNKKYDLDAVKSQVKMDQGGEAAILLRGPIGENANPIGDIKGDQLQPPEIIHK
ncbi:MAG TPA: hypothetical protein PK176_13345 [Acidobacteriota bacterium]|nr:hypothetical protein [Acidobacteriota bacterium]HQM64288.1 hypothetical protein [Acidobacteriota bacterium]